MPLALEDVDQHLPHRGFVLRHEDARAPARARRRRLGRRQGQLGPDRQAHGEAAPLAGPAPDLDLPAVTRHDAVRDRQAEAGPVLRLRREEGLEAALPDRLAHAGARVLDDAHDAIALGPRRERQGPALRHRVERVEEQVQEGLPQLGGIAGHRRHRREVEPHRVRHGARLGQVAPVRPGRLDHLADDLGDVDVLPGTGPAHPRELLDAADRLGAVLGDVLDDLELPAQIGRVDLALQELGAPDDHGEDVVEIVGDAARHLAQRAEALAPDDPLLGLLHRHEGRAQLRVEPAVLESHRPLGRQRQRQVLGARGERDGPAGDVVERREAPAPVGLPVHQLQHPEHFALRGLHRHHEHRLRAVAGLEVQGAVDRERRSRRRGVRRRRG